MLSQSWPCSAPACVRVSGCGLTLLACSRCFCVQDRMKISKLGAQVRNALTFTGSSRHEVNTVAFPCNQLLMQLTALHPAWVHAIAEAATA